MALTREREALAWRRVRRYYNAILMHDPLPKGAVAAELEFVYWECVVERRQLLKTIAKDMSYYEGFLDGRSSGLQEARIRAGGDPMMANWPKPKILAFLKKKLRQTLTEWDRRKQQDIDYWKKEKREKQPKDRIVKLSTWGDGTIDGRIHGLRTAIKIMLDPPIYRNSQ